MYSKEVLENFLKWLPFFLPVRKPPGICALKLREAVRNDFHFALWQSHVNHGEVELAINSYLEPFADGVLTFRFGPNLQQLKKMVFARCVYRATIEFGVEHEYNTVDGNFLDRVDIDHLTAEDLQQSIFTTDAQTKMFGIPMSERIIDRSPNEVARLYNTMPTTEAAFKHNPQKYKLELPKRIVTCDSVRLLSYNKPFAELQIECQSSFSIRAYTKDLAEKLETKATLIRLTRIQEGPISVEDLRLLQIHELAIEYYTHRIRAFRSAFRYYEPTLDERQEKMIEERALKGKGYKKFM